MVVVFGWSHSTGLLRERKFVEDVPHVAFESKPDLGHAQDIEDRGQATGHTSEDDTFCEDVESGDEDYDSSETFQHPDGEIEACCYCVHPLSAPHLCFRDS